MSAALMNCLDVSLMTKHPVANMGGGIMRKITLVILLAVLSSSAAADVLKQDEMIAARPEITKIDTKWVEEAVYPSSLLAMRCVDFNYDEFEDDKERKRWVVRIAPLIRDRLESDYNKAAREVLILHYESVRQGLDPYLVAGLLDVVGAPYSKRRKDLVGPFPIDRGIIQSIKRRAIEKSDSLCFDFDELRNSARVATTLLRALLAEYNGDLYLSLRAYATYGMKLPPNDIDNFPDEVKVHWQSLLH